MKYEIFQLKENDRTALIEQYREATNELSRAKMTLVDLETLANNLNQELQMKSSDNKRLTERIDYLERDLQQVKFKSSFSPSESSILLFKHNAVGQEYEHQLTNMNRSIQRNEDLVKKLQLDKQNLINELNNLRDLNATIDNKKEQILRQLTSKDIENEQLQSIISDMKIEIDMLRTQINNEKAVVQSLEELIGSLRDKEFQIQIHAQERDSDFHLAKDRANMSDLKV